MFIVLVLFLIYIGSAMGIFLLSALTHWMLDYVQRYNYVYAVTMRQNMNHDDVTKVAFLPIVNTYALFVGLGAYGKLAWSQRGLLKRK